tara:strand:- start:245 stop:421 length:177 start_codon:yes stop_codon:yes gene_type:complete
LNAVKKKIELNNKPNNPKIFIRYIRLYLGKINSPIRYEKTNNTIEIYNGLALILGCII